MRSICMGSVNHAAPCLSSVAIDLHDYTMPPVWHFPLDHQGLGQTVGGNFRLTQLPRDRFKVSEYPENPEASDLALDPKRPARLEASLQSGAGDVRGKT